MNGTLISHAALWSSEEIKSVVLYSCTFQPLFCSEDKLQPVILNPVSLFTCGMFQTCVWWAIQGTVCLFPRSQLEYATAQHATLFRISVVENGLMDISQPKYLPASIKVVQEVNKNSHSAQGLPITFSDVIDVNLFASNKASFQSVHSEGQTALLEEKNVFEAKCQSGAIRLCRFTGSLWTTLDGALSK